MKEREVSGLCTWLGGGAVTQIRNTEGRDRLKEVSFGHCCFWNDWETSEWRFQVGNWGAQGERSGLKFTSQPSGQSSIPPLPHSWERAHESLCSLGCQTQWMIFSLISLSLCSIWHSWPHCAQTHPVSSVTPLLVFSLYGCFTRFLSTWFHQILIKRELICKCIHILISPFKMSIFVYIL